MPCQLGRALHAVEEEIGVATNVTAAAAAVTTMATAIGAIGTKVEIQAQEIAPEVADILHRFAIAVTHRPREIVEATRIELVTTTAVETVTATALAIASTVMMIEIYIGTVLIGLIEMVGVTVMLAEAGIGIATVGETEIAAKSGEAVIVTNFPFRSKGLGKHEIRRIATVR